MVCAQGGLCTGWMSGCTDHILIGRLRITQCRYMWVVPNPTHTKYGIVMPLMWTFHDQMHVFLTDCFSTERSYLTISGARRGPETLVRSSIKQQSALLLACPKELFPTQDYDQLKTCKAINLQCSAQNFKSSTSSIISFVELHCIQKLLCLFKLHNSLCQI